jgi:hypothetical protein
MTGAGCGGALEPTGAGHDDGVFKPVAELTEPRLGRSSHMVGRRRPGGVRTTGRRESLARQQPGGVLATCSFLFMHCDIFEFLFCCSSMR